MKVTLLAFGIVKDIIKSNRLELELPPGNATAGAVQSQLEAQFPEMKELTSCLVAINNTYASPEDPIREQDEIAIIPPVSGG